MMEHPKFSIVIATFNASRTLEAAIQSVLRQTYTNWELIVIDGGSSDTTVEIVRRYADRIAHWVSEKDKGIYNAWNKGVAAAVDRLFKPTFYSHLLVPSGGPARADKAI